MQKEKSTHRNHGVLSTQEPEKLQRIIVVSDLHLDIERLHEMDGFLHDGHTVVFLGDAVDSRKDWVSGHGITSPVDYLRCVAELARQHPDTFVWLIGNHELHYIYHKDKQRRCTGFDPLYASAYHDILMENKAHWKVAHLHRPYLFSHAGFGHEYIKAVEDRENRYMSMVDIVADANELPDEVFEAGAGADSWGKFDGPLWLRPSGYTLPVFPYLYQIVGHTHLPNIVRQKHNMIVVDTGRPYIIEL